LSILQSLRKNWFLVGLLVVITAAVLLPGLGKEMNAGGLTTKIIVLILFLSAGFTLPSEQIKSGLRNYKLHLYLQLFVFGIIPLYFFITARFFNNYLDGYVVIGLYALAVLPTTLSTSVVFTQTSGGNVVGALFNSAFANVAGIFISPLLLSLFLSGTVAALPSEEIASILKSLVLTMLVPVVVGQLLRRIFTTVANHIRKKLTESSSLLILLIVFMTVSSTAANPEFYSMLLKLAVPFIFLAVSHILFVFLSLKGAKLLKFSEEDCVCVIFVGPQKTMAMGIPLLSVYFASRPDLLALAIFPLLFYHPFQLLIAGFLRSMVIKKSARESI